MSDREPFFAKYIRASDRATQVGEQVAAVSELTLALDAASWFSRGGIND